MSAELKGVAGVFAEIRIWNTNSMKHLETASREILNRHKQRVDVRHLQRRQAGSLGSRSRETLNAHTTELKRSGVVIEGRNYFRGDAAFQARMRIHQEGGTIKAKNWTPKGHRTPKLFVKLQRKYHRSYKYGPWPSKWGTEHVILPKQVKIDKNMRYFEIWDEMAGERDAILEAAKDKAVREANL